MPKKETSPSSANSLAVSGLSGKSVTAVNVHQHGDITVIEISFSGGSSFIKVRKGQVKVGGTEEWDTGTLVIG